MHSSILQQLKMLHSFPASLPEGITVLVEWTQESTIWSKPHVSALIHHDSSWLQCSQDGEFFHHILPFNNKHGEVLKKLYYTNVPPRRFNAAMDLPGTFCLVCAILFPTHSILLSSSSPLPSRLLSIGPSYLLEPIIQRAAKLFEHRQYMDSRGVPQFSASSPPLSAPSPSPNHSSPQISARVVKETIVDSVGIFTAFCDGRVRVKFFDRTILEIANSRDVCEIMRPDGKIIVLRCGVVAALLCFILLCFALFCFGLLWFGEKWPSILVH